MREHHIPLDRTTPEVLARVDDEGRCVRERVENFTQSIEFISASREPVKAYVCQSGSEPSGFADAVHRIAPYRLRFLRRGWWHEFQMTLAVDSLKVLSDSSGDFGFTVQIGIRAGSEFPAQLGRVLPADLRINEIALHHFRELFDRLTRNASSVAATRGDEEERHKQVDDDRSRAPDHE